MPPAVSPALTALHATDRPAIYRLDLWGALPAPAADAIRARSVRRRYRDGVTLAQRGQRITRVIVVEHGRLRAVSRSLSGDEHLFRWVEPGEPVGLGAVITGLPFQTDLVSSGDSEVLSIPGEALLAAMRADAEVAVAVARFLAVRLSELFDHAVTQAEARLDDRLRAALAYLAAENGEPLNRGRVALRVTQGDVAQAVGASRQRVHEALHRLQRSGDVELGYRRLVVDLGKLARGDSRP